MDRQVGRKKRRGRPLAEPTPSGAARPERASREASGREEPPAPYPAAPHDETTERELAGALAGFKHYGNAPDPADFYDPALGRIARAFTEHRGRIRFRTTVHVKRGDSYTFAYTYTGLEEVLEELGSSRPRRDALFAGIIALEAPVTDRADVRRLADLANARRRLIELETERADLERLAQGRR